jgi:hypothetical protein
VRTRSARSGQPNTSNDCARFAAGPLASSHNKTCLTVITEPSRTRLFGCQRQAGARLTRCRVEPAARPAAPEGRAAMHLSRAFPAWPLQRTSFVADGARPLRDQSAGTRARDRPRGNFPAWVHITAAIGVQSKTSWPCGQDSQPKPGCHRRRHQRHEARGGVTGFDCGAGPVLLPALPHRPGGFVAN